MQQKPSSESANGGFRGAFRFPRKTGFAGSPGNSIDFRQMNCRKSDAGTRRRGYKGPPAAFLSTFRRWKVDAVLRARRRGTSPTPHSRRASEHTDCKFSPSVACGDSSLVRGSQACGGRAAHQKNRPVCLTKRLRGAIVVSVRTAAIAVAVVPIASL